MAWGVWSCSGWDLRGEEGRGGREGERRKGREEEEGKGRGGREGERRKGRGEEEGKGRGGKGRGEEEGKGRGGGKGRLDWHPGQVDSRIMMVG